MNKAKKLDYKKSIVRNTEQTKPKTVVIQEPPELSYPTPVFHKTTSEERVSKLTTNGKSKLGSPELNSALRIARKIETIESMKPRKVKSISDLDKRKSSFVNEEAAKEVNFPYSQPMYKDLIPLCVRAQQPQPLPSISREMLPKDSEPSLSDFFTPKVLPEYSFEVPLQRSHKTPSSQFDGFKLYRTIRNWDDDNV